MLYRGFGSACHTPHFTIIQCIHITVNHFFTRIIFAVATLTQRLIVHCQARRFSENNLCDLTKIIHFNRT